jgi:hypothetical protein
MRKALSFLDSHELSGHWFLPQNGEHRCAGRLEFSMASIALRLLEPLRVGIADPRHGEVDDNGIPVVFGRTINGEAVSLFHSLPDDSLTYFGSAGEEVCAQTIHPHIVVVGAHVQDEQQVFPAMSARIPGLLTWLGVSAIEEAVAIREKGLRSVGLTFSVRPQSSSSAELTHLPGFVKVSKFVDQSGQRFGTVTLKSEGWLEIRPSSPLTIDALLKGLNRLMSLVGLIAGPCMHFDAIELAIDNEVSAGLLFHPNRHRVCEITEQHQFLVPYDSVCHELPALMDTWLASMPRIETVNALLESAMVLERPPLHLLFLTLTHALEGLHRSTHPGVYMDPTAYRAVYEEIAEGLPGSLGTDHRQSLKRRVEFGNEISFRRRLGDLVKSLPAELRLLVVGHASGVPDVWVNTRNYYTHWTNDLKKEAAEGADLYCLNTRLMTLARVLLLRLAGVPAKVIISALRGRSRWARELAHVAQMERRV